RDRTRSRRYSPAKEQFRREHARHRDWGLAKRYAEKLRRLRGDTPPAVSDQRDRSVQEPVPPSPPPPVTPSDQAKRPASSTAANDCDPAPRQVGGAGRPGPVPKRRRASTPQLRRPAGPATHRMVGGNTRPPVHRGRLSTMPHTAGRHFRRILRKARISNRCPHGPPLPIPEFLDNGHRPRDAHIGVTVKITMITTMSASAATSARIAEILNDQEFGRIPVTTRCLGFAGRHRDTEIESSGLDQGWRGVLT
ncbi:hypothetical protein AB0367_37665, partial [Dactylosporangium sp. NPDC051484]